MSILKHLQRDILYIFISFDFIKILPCRKWVIHYYNFIYIGKWRLTCLRVKPQCPSAACLPVPNTSLWETGQVGGSQNSAVQNTSSSDFISVVGWCLGLSFQKRHCLLSSSAEHPGRAVLDVPCPSCKSSAPSKRAPCSLFRPPSDE